MPKPFLRRQTYYVAVEVPPSVRGAVGSKRIVRSLRTRSYAEAVRRSYAEVADIKGHIERIRKAASLGRSDEVEQLKAEAAGLRDERRRTDASHLDGLDYFVHTRAEQIVGKPVGEAYDPARLNLAKRFVDAATGQATHVDEYLEHWLAEAGYTARTAFDHRRAVKALSAEGIDALEEVSRKRAGEFVSALIARKIAARTVNKYKSSLSSYWKWLRQKGILDENVPNPWTDQPVAVPKAHLTGASAQKRPFTDDEMRALLGGDPGPMLADLIRIAALSGMRIGEICRLTVATCADGVFKITQSKSKAGVRVVPIHRDLKVLLERRTKGKHPNAYLIHELPDLPRGDPREKSMPAVKKFGRYTRRLGIADVPAGARQSVIDFHSFRRFFITKAEQAGQPLPTIQAVVGHEREGMTFGLYSGGPSLEQLRACVNAVKLPKLQRGEK